MSLRQTSESRMGRTSSLSVQLVGAPRGGWPSASRMFLGRMWQGSEFGAWTSV